MSHRALCVGLCAESPTQRNGEGLLEFRMPTQEKWTPLRALQHSRKCFPLQRREDQSWLTVCRARGCALRPACRAQLSNRQHGAAAARMNALPTWGPAASCEVSDGRRHARRTERAVMDTSRGVPVEEKGRHSLGTGHRIRT